MFRHALRIATIFIVTQSLLLSSLAAPRTEEKPTLFEGIKAQEISNLFMKRLEETGDFSRVIDDLFVEDFMWRYVQEQKRDAAESNSPAAISFTLGLDYKPELLTQATTQDWRRLYVATYNFFYHVMVLGLNQSANDLLNDKEPDDEVFEKLLPANVSLLLDGHPILKNLLESKGEPKAIETLEELRDVSETLEMALRLLQSNQTMKLTVESKQVLEKFKLGDFAEPRLEIAENEYFGYPAGTRMLLAITPLLLGLRLVDVNGTQKILWAELDSGC